MTFTDTGAWFGLFVTQDFNHIAALDWYKKNRNPLVTTDYIVDETLTLLKHEGRKQYL